jgi:hypothetical protein
VMIRAAMPRCCKRLVRSASAMRTYSAAR